MRFIKEHKIILTILSVLLILAVLFAVSASGDRSGNIITNTINKIDDTFRTTFSVRSLKGQVEVLQNENAELKKELLKSEFTKDELSELKELSKVLNYDYVEKEYEVIACDITSMDGTNYTNIFTINRGSEAGIVVGDSVCNGLGLIGRIQETGKGWSKVVSIIDEDSSVSFKLARKTSQKGILSGDKDGNLTGYMLDAESTVAEGDLLLTSGLGIFPEGIEVGSVKVVTFDESSLLKRIVVEPTANFKELDKVAIIKIKESKKK